MHNDEPGVSRRAVLGSLAGGTAASMAGCSFFDQEDDAPTSEVTDERAEELAEMFAPTLYFDEHERWFPTDPRSYERDEDGTAIVNGFDALDGYVANGGADDPPDPTSFFHVLEYDDSPLAVVQYWFYSVFDQFTTNFHWHDWELLQVFVDTETDEAQLYVASSHSRSVPNNEHLDPVSDEQPRLLSELGSHSSGLSVNDQAEHFNRVPVGDSVADITNSIIEGMEDIAALPMAYGLPRDEGLALPFARPELDGDLLHEHEDLPNVDASDLVPDILTITSFDALQVPPTDLPQRATGYRFEHEDRDVSAADVEYGLVPSQELEHIEDYTGPQLSFEFAIPDFAEDLVASHISTSGVFWKDNRYDNPASDISETNHRSELADRYDAIGDPSQFNQVVAKVTNAVSSDDAPEDEGLTTVSSPIEFFALFQSEPEAVPTFNGVAVVQDVPAGEHQLTINGAGVTPHSETVTVSDGGGPTRAGANGEIPTVARENAVKLEVDPEEADSDLSDLAVEDDFAGKLYDAPLSGPDAVYVHQGGAFTTEVQDTDDEVGAFRVNPSDEESVRIDKPDTGKAPLATYLADVAGETRAQVEAIADDDDAGDSDDDSPGNSDDQGSAVTGLANALAAVEEAAQRAAENARANDRANTDQQLEAVATRLEQVASRLEEARGSLPPEIANAADNRLEQVERRNQQALDAEKL